MTPNRQAEVQKIVAELRQKIQEIEELKERLNRFQRSPFSAEKSRAMLEEIKVPSLEALRETEREARAAYQGKARAAAK
ncbi:MAG TPA: hypothetical protein HA252_01980 [Candidatus Diapherotrites archaeon]|uniref:Uncharacterized protein n=1 Tax=Candidatus Iainarchaeum sp. TaxID=3101447 RepID=A0A7J4JEH1_9ARCH|nr:hypothetical protein [Candidatus Diapherotrites archaeon]HIH16153.1 hypothetical protein [Candidatus Diapherotrites archaeon]